MEARSLSSSVVLKLRRKHDKNAALVCDDKSLSDKVTNVHLHKKMFHYLKGLKWRQKPFDVKRPTGSTSIGKTFNYSNFFVIYIDCYDGQVENR